MKITPTSEALGARVEGLDLSKPLDGATVAALKQAWRDHLVLVFPDQNLTPTQQCAFAQYFGDLVEHPMTVNMPAPEKGLRAEQRTVSAVTHYSRTNGWHQDMTCMEVPFSFSLLYGVQPLERPDLDDDTCFCNLYRAYESLSPGMQEFLKETRAVHSGAYLIDPKRKGGNYRNPQDGTSSGATNAEEFGIPTEQLHPCVRLHPETNRPLLYCNPGFVTNFEGWSKKESMTLVKQLETTATRPENVYRHKWRKNDLLCWDNRAVMHLGPPSQTWPKDVKRYMIRATVTPSTEVRPYGLAGGSVKRDAAWSKL